MKICHILRLVIFSATLVLASCSSSTGPSSQENAQKSATKTDSSAKRPNILLIVIDDIGFNDLGVFGSEINTPNLDSLANEGVLLTDFMVAPNCSPTRAMLLSGTDPHVAGLGNMAELLEEDQRGKPGYEGYLNFRIAALPEVLKDAGYHTYMTGKWHLGLGKHVLPYQRGFDQTFATLQGGAGAFSNMLPLFGHKPGDKALYSSNGEFVESLPEDFYSTKFQAEKMIEYIGNNHGDGKPFFGYLAFTAPHWPLQAPDESIAKFKGVYDEGYDVLKAKRLQALIDQRIFPADTQPFPRFANEKAWDELTDEEQRYNARVMETFAAMVYDVDTYTGKVIDYLKEIGEYENTFIFVTSDNGPEAHPVIGLGQEVVDWVEMCCDNSYENIGKPDSYIMYGENWGQAGNTPFRMYKGYTAMGGVKAPAFAHYPAGISKGVRINSMITAMDVMPTFLEVADVDHPGTRFRDRDVVEMAGRSMLTVLKGEAESAHSDDYYMGWELFGKRSIRQGDWKINYVPSQPDRSLHQPSIKENTWQLYNLAEDPAELIDVAAEHPERLAKMIALWDDYVKMNGVVLAKKISYAY